MDARVSPIQPFLYAPGIPKGRETDDYKTNSSPKFGYFEVVFYARNLASEDVGKTYNVW
jgi:hypothetical protein